MKIDVGVKFGKFIIDNIKQGSGSSADVVQVSFIDEPKRTCLAKIFRDRERLNHYENEIQSLKRLNFTGRIPAYIDSGFEEGVPYIAMERIEGCSLTELLANGESIDIPDLKHIIQQLLELVNYCNKQRVCHGDIKLDNVIYDQKSKQVGLIDFGLSRLLDVKNTSYDLDFGVREYAPPSKIEKPSQRDSSHDVFAVGVIAYYLLMSRYPWVLPESSNSTYKDYIRNTQPARIVTKYPTEIELDDLVYDLLELDDADRMSPEVAYERAIFSEQTDFSREIRYVPTPITPHVFRDSVHGDIFLTSYEWRVINSPEFQRLRYVKQLGATNFVFAGATHNRMTHSIGCLHVVEKIMSTARNLHNAKINPSVWLQARLYALLHDICHIPFGHTLEDELNLFPRHDEQASRLERLLDKHYQKRESRKYSLLTILNETEYGRKTLEVLRNKQEQTIPDKFAKELVASELGADVLDYINRDAYYCGLTESIDDSIYRRFKISRTQGGPEHLTIKFEGSKGKRSDIVSAIRRVFSTRYCLFEKVYCHPAKIAIGAMLGKSVYHYLLKKEKDKRSFKQHLIEKIEFMGDEELLLTLMNSSKQSVYALAHRIYYRQIYKPAFVHHMCDDRDIIDFTKDVNDDKFDRFMERKIKKLEVKITENKKLPTLVNLTDPHGRDMIESYLIKQINKQGFIGGEFKVKNGQILFYVEARPPGYKRELKIAFKHDFDSKLIAEAAHSQVTARHLTLWKLFVFFDPQLIEVGLKASVIGEMIVGMLNLENHLFSDDTALNFYLDGGYYSIE